jgi:hypothetical protein
MRAGVDVPEPAAVSRLLPRRVAPAGVCNHVAVGAEQRLDDPENGGVSDGPLGKGRAVEHLVAEILVLLRVADRRRAAIGWQIAVDRVDLRGQRSDLVLREDALEHGVTVTFQGLGCRWRVTAEWQQVTSNAPEHTEPPVSGGCPRAATGAL